MKKYIIAVSIGLLGCGQESGSTQEPTDGTVQDSIVDTGYVETTSIFHDVITPDVPDTGTFDVIDGGGGCTVPEDTGNGAWTCCNGTLCDGVCVVFTGESSSVCWCAGIRGGCAGGTVCCLTKESCTTACPRGGI